MGTRTFTRDELEELGLPDDSDYVVHTEQVDTRRWYTVHTCVFHTDEEGPLWRVKYYKPATEEQECDVWDPHGEPDTIQAVEVEPYQVEVTRYRPIRPVEPEPATTIPGTLGPGGWPLAEQTA
jgi:hypothetical protein